MKDITVIILTRKRPESLINAVNTLLNTKSEKTEIEIFIGYDSDDETIVLAKNYFSETSEIEFIEFPPLGFYNLYVHQNSLIPQITGKWVMLWSDDSKMLSRNWDLYILEHEFCGLNPVVINEPTYDETLYPIIPKKWLDVTGRFANNVCADLWIGQVAKALNIFVRDNRIIVFHDKSFKPDNGQYDMERYNSQYNERQEDINKILSSGALESVCDISVICPTRNRPELLVRSIESLITTKSTYRVEFLIGYDNDDETINPVKEHFKNNKEIKFIEFEPLGYKKMFVYLNTLAKISKGEWLFVFSDDGIMESSDWDKYIMEHKEFCLINPVVSNMRYWFDNNEPLYFVIPKKWLEITGRMSNNAHSDTWLGAVARMAGILRGDDRISILHDRFDETGNNKDETYLKREYDKDRYWTQETEVLEDVNKILTSGIIK